MRYGAAFIICFPGLKRARDDAAVLIESNGCGGVAGVAQHVAHALVLFLRVQHIGLARMLRAPCAADAVRVIFVGVRHIVVEHGVHLGHVDAPFTQDRKSVV